MPTIKCTICRWRGEINLKKSTYRCESCGSEAIEVEEVKELPPPAIPELPQPADLSRRKKKITLKLRKVVFDMFSARLDKLLKESPYSIQQTPEEIKIILTAALEADLSSGQYDRFLDPQSSSPNSIVNRFKDLYSRYSVWDNDSWHIEQSLGFIISNYYNYCTNPDVIEEEKEKK